MNSISIDEEIASLNMEACDQPAQISSVNMAEGS
jgi:hypothetical protein